VNGRNVEVSTLYFCAVKVYILYDFVAVLHFLIFSNRDVFMGMIGKK
jgi:hypothetical protein